MKKGYLVTVIVTFIMLLIVAIGIEVYDVFQKKDKCKAEEKKECVCEKVANGVDNKKEEKLYENDVKYDVKIVSYYKGNIKMNKASEDFPDSELIELYLYDDNTYYFRYEYGAESGDLGAYKVENNEIIFKKYLHHDNGSGLTFEGKIETIKYKIKDNKLYNYNDESIVLEKSNTTNRGYPLFESLFNYLRYGERVSLSEAENGGIIIDA